MKQVLYTKYNRLRRPEYRISTMICEENGKRTVIKKALTKAARGQIEQIYKNSKDIGKIYEKLEILIPQYQTDRVIFDFIEGENLEHRLVKLIDDFDALTKAIHKELEIITDISPEYRILFQVTDGYKKVFGDIAPEMTEDAFSYSNMDVLFDNIIIQGERYICLDCEWVFHFPIPVKFIKYRSLFYFYQKYAAYLKKWTDLDRFLNLYGISTEEKHIFMEMERQFQMYVVGQDFEYDYVYKYEKENLTLEEAFVDRKSAENREEALQAEIKNISSISQKYQKELEAAREQNQKNQLELQNRNARIRQLDTIAEERLKEIQRLNHEMDLKEQHVVNLTECLNSMRSSKWFKLQNKVSTIKSRLHK